MDDLTRRRLERNEAVFRAVNEEIDGHGPDDSAHAYVCECADLRCRETIILTHDEYRRVRQVPSQFAIVQGHEVPEIERVVARLESHLVVEKR
jgi:hypothetical protein